MAKSNFKSIIKSKHPVLIDFHADWCGPCHQFAPILKELKKKEGDNIKIVKIDVDKNKLLAQQLNVRSIPTTMIYQNGELKFRAAGVQKISTLQKEIKKLKPSKE